MANKETDIPTAEGYLKTKGYNEPVFNKVLSSLMQEYATLLLRKQKEYISGRIFANDNWASVETLNSASEEFIKQLK